MTEIKRRTILKLGAGAAAAAVTSVGFNAVTKNGSTNSVEPFFGKHQAGIATKPQEHATWVAFKLKAETDKQAVGRLMRLWTTDAAKLAAGSPALADNESTLAIGESNLTITFGFGPQLLSKFSNRNLGDLPNFSIDKLQSYWCGGDLLIQVCGNDQIKVHHAIRELTSDAKPFADLHWRQTGFLPNSDIKTGQTPRNLMGQKDGTANYHPDSVEFKNTVWLEDGSTTMVIRRIQMDLDKWETLSPDLKEKVIGRKLDSGAPLTGGHEFSTADFEKTDHHGLVIPGDSHMRRARAEKYKIHRRGYNYQTDTNAEGEIDHGLVFVSYQAKLDQFIEIQRRLESMDSLNTWTRPIGSAVFLIPPGIDSLNGQWIGQTII